MDLKEKQKKFEGLDQRAEQVMLQLYKYLESSTVISRLLALFAEGNCELGRNLVPRAFSLFFKMAS